MFVDLIDEWEMFVFCFRVFFGVVEIVDGEMFFQGWCFGWGLGILFGLVLKR